LNQFQHNNGRSITGFISLVILFYFWALRLIL